MTKNQENKGIFSEVKQSQIGQKENASVGKTSGGKKSEIENMEKEIPEVEHPHKYKAPEDNEGNPSKKK